MISTPGSKSTTTEKRRVRRERRNNGTGMTAYRYREQIIK